MLTDRRDELARLRVEILNLLELLLSELIPGQRNLAALLDASDSVTKRLRTIDALDCVMIR